jgi:hypothetical protein
MVSIFLVQQGCTTSALKLWTPHIPEDMRATIRTIEVAVVAELPRVSVESPSETASYAKRKAWNWTENWGKVTGEVLKGGDPIFTTTAGAMLVVPPVVWGAGAVYGADDGCSYPGTFHLIRTPKE